MRISTKLSVRRYLALVAAIVATVALASCSSSGSSSDGSGGGSNGLSTWTIGSIVSSTGGSSSLFAGAKDALAAWAKYVNANGGINGHHIKVETLDDQATAANGLAAAHTLVQGDHVLALVGSADSSAPGWKSYVMSSKIPVIGTMGAVGSDFDTSDLYFYPSGTSYKQQKPLTFAVAKAKGLSKVGTIYCAEDPSCLKAVGINTSQIQALGLTFTKAVKIAANAPSYLAPCLALQDAGTTAVATAVPTAEVKLVAESCAKQGYYPTYLAGPESVIPDWLTDPAFKNAAGIANEFPWWDTSNPAIATFNQVMQQDAPDVLKSNPAVAAEVWASGMVFEAGAKAANLGNNPTPQQLADGLNTISNDTFDGLTPPITYTDNDRTVGCAYEVDVENGAFHLLNDGKIACAQ